MLTLKQIYTGSLFIFIILLGYPYELLSQSKIKGNRNVKMEQSVVDVFHTLSVGNELEVILVKSPNPSVTIEADGNLHPAIQYQVTDSILNFQITKRIKRAREFKVIIRYTDVLEHIILSDDVDVKTENPIQLSKVFLLLKDDAKIEADVVSDEFSLENNNDSKLKFSTNCVLNIESKAVNLNLKKNSNNSVEVNAEEINISAFDDAELDIEGFSYKLNLDASDNSGIKADDLLTNVSTLKISGNSEVDIQATDTISIDATGASKVKLYGEPKVKIDRFSGTSEILKKE